MSMTVADMQAKFRKVVEKADKLAARTGLSGEEAARLDGLLKEGDALRSGIERAARLESIKEWGSQLHPIPALAGGDAGRGPAGQVRVEGFSDAGQVSVARDGRGGFVVEDEAAGGLDPKVRAAIGT